MIGVVTLVRPPLHDSLTYTFGGIASNRYGSGLLDWRVRPHRTTVSEISNNLCDTTLSCSIPGKS